MRRFAAGPRLLPTVLALAVFAVGLYMVATTAAMVVRCWSLVPFWDQWENLIFDPGQVFSAWLFAQHNEHRIVLPRLLFAIDAFAFRETQRFNFFCNVALPLALAGLLVALARRATGRGAADTLWLGGIVLATLFSAMQAENFVWGFQVQFFGVELAACGAFAILALARPRAATLAAAIGCAAAALFTLSSGAVALAVALPLAWRAGWPRRHLAVLAIAGVLLLALYLHGYVTPDYHSDPLQTVAQPRVALYVAGFLGNPFGHLVPARRAIAVALAAGGFGLVLFAAFGATLLHRGRDADRAQLALLATAAFVVGFGVLAGLGRLKFGLVQTLSSRYATPALLFWLSLALIAVAEIRRGWPQLRVPVMALGLLGTLILAWPQRHSVADGAAWVAPRRSAETALLAGVDDAQALRRLFPDTALVERQAARLRERHLAMFAEPWSGWLGTPLAAHVRLAGDCDGAVVTIERIAGGARVGGWVADGRERPAPRRLVLTDAGGAVVGYALSGFPTDEPHAAGWQGHVAGASEGLAAYALFDGDSAACRLAR